MSEVTDSTKQSAEARKEGLARAVAQSVRNGWSPQSQTDFQAVMVKGGHVNNVLHLVLTLITLGLWLFVWIPMLYFGREQHEVIDVDPYGNVNISQS